MNYSKILYSMILCTSLVYAAPHIETIKQTVVMGDVTTKIDARKHALDMAKYNVLNKQLSYVEYEFSKTKDSTGNAKASETIRSIGGGYVTAEMIPSTETIKDGVYSAEFKVNIDMDSLKAKVKSIEENQELKSQVAGLNNAVTLSQKAFINVNSKIDALIKEIAENTSLSIEAKEKKINDLASEQAKAIENMNNANNLVTLMLKRSAKIANDITIAKAQKADEERKLKEIQKENADNAYYRFLAKNDLPLQYQKDYWVLALIYLDGQIAKGKNYNKEHFLFDLTAITIKSDETFSGTGGIDSEILNYFFTELYHANAVPSWMTYDGYRDQSNPNSIRVDFDYRYGSADHYLKQYGHSGKYVMKVYFNNTITDEASMLAFAMLKKYKTQVERNIAMIFPFGSSTNRSSGGYTIQQ